MNVWAFTGNLGDDCTRKTTQGGMAICSFSVAVKSGYGDKAKTVWVDCSIFGKKAESALPNFLTKGAKVGIVGEVSLDEWTAKGGSKQKTLRVAVDNVDLLDSKPKAESAPTEAKKAAPYASKTMPQESFDSLTFDDSIPDF